LSASPRCSTAPGRPTQESGGEQQQTGAEGSGAAAELTEWQKARIAEYQDAQTAQSGVSGQAAQGME